MQEILKKYKNENMEQQQVNEQQEFVIDVNNLDLRKEIKNAVSEYSKDYVEKNLEKSLDQIVNEAVKKLAPVYVKVGARKQVKIEGRTHKGFKECLFLAEQERQVFIAGPAGSGKTTLASQIAKALGLPFAHISCSAGMSEAHLLGRMLFDGTYVASDFIRVYEEGGVFLMDEVDAADANTLLIINSALANGILSVPNRKEKTHAERNKDFILIASANTWGNGSFEYHGRNSLDAAFLDRFVLSRMQIDYDRPLEKEICSSYPGLAETIWKIRDNCTKHKIRRIVSTRAFVSGAAQLACGKTPKQFLDRFTTGWTKEEIAKATDGIDKLEESQEEESTVSELSEL